MSAHSHALAPEARARLAADHRARRGPFRHDVVSAYEVASHYSMRRLPVAAFLNEVAFFSMHGCKCGASYMLYAIDPKVPRLPAKGVYDHFLVERGRPPKWGTGS